jgi:hypothetical protein
MRAFMLDDAVMLNDPKDKPSITPKYSWAVAECEGMWDS